MQWRSEILYWHLRHEMPVWHMTMTIYVELIIKSAREGVAEPNVGSLVSILMLIRSGWTRAVLHWWLREGSGWISFRLACYWIICICALIYYRTFKGCYSAVFTSEPSHLQHITTTMPNSTSVRLDSLTNSQTTTLMHALVKWVHSEKRSSVQMRPRYVNQTVSRIFNFLFRAFI